MSTKVFMEALSPTMEEGRLVKWLKAEGDAVKQGDVLAEVETDKAVMELAARGEGVLRKQLVAEGETTAVGSLVGVIAGADEDIDDLVGGEESKSEGKDASGERKDSNGEGEGEGEGEEHADSEAAPSKPSAPSKPGAASKSSSENKASSESSPKPSAAPSGGRVTASPIARRMADEGGLDIRNIEGSGPGGRVIKRDIEAAMKGGGGRASGAGVGARDPFKPVDATAVPARSSAGVDGPGYRDEPLTQIRKTIARRLGESIGPIPTFYLTAEFDMSRAAEMRTAAAEMGDGFKVSFNDIILKAVATALTKHPEVNAHWLGDKIRYFDTVHLGMAVATDDGLIVPVIFDAQTKGMAAISAESKALAKRARERKLKPEEFTGSTFSVSNLGMMQIDQFTAIINPPEVGILAIGALEDRVVVGSDGGFTTRKTLRVTMSCDHRVVDGAVGARFLQTLRRLLENPLLLVM